MGHPSCGSQWWIPSSRCPGPGLTNLWFCLLTWGFLLWAEFSRSSSAPSPSFPVPCSRISFSFASDSTQLLPQANMYLAALHAVVQHTGKNEPSCWHLGPWANKQKRKMVHVGDDEVKRKIGTERWLRSLPFSPPNLHHSQAARSAPCSLSVRVRRILLTLGISLGWKELLGVHGFHAGVGWCA